MTQRKKADKSALEKFRDYMLGSDYDDEDEDLAEDEEYYESPRYKSRPERDYGEREKAPERASPRERPEKRMSGMESNVVNLPGTGFSGEAATVIIFHPEVVDDASEICGRLKENKICAVNLEDIEKANAQRIADFLGGACYALGGDIQRISSSIFIIAPPGVTISNELKNEFKSKGDSLLSWLPAAFK
ncbi:MAG: cell division protein SepF [Clostridiales bacterium]|jgi:cell division inhibitor SepF|nr:cell division protein SepF [Clostridiales bacterium]